MSTIKVTDLNVAANVSDSAKLLGIQDNGSGTQALYQMPVSDITTGLAENLASTVGVDDKVPYNFRTSGGSVDIGDREELKAVVGGTIAWNQLRNNGNFASTSGWVAANGTASVSNNVYTLVPNGTKSGTLNYGIRSSVTFNVNHVYFVSFTAKSSKGDKFRGRYGNKTWYSDTVSANTWVTSETIVTNNTLNADSSQFTFYAYNDAQYTSNDTISFKNVWLCDLTLMFGSTIADYVYSLETANAGDGVAWVGRLFPADYYAYDAGTLMSVKTSAHKMIGFNAYNHTAGTAHVVGGKVYQITGTYTALSLDGETITPDASGYFTPTKNGTLTVSGGNSTDTCVHLKWDGERDGDYEPYKEWTYALDDDLELRGIPKLDADNRLYYDGDSYAPDGTVTRKRHQVTIDGVNVKASLVRESNGVYYSTYVLDVPGVNTSANVKTIINDQNYEEARGVVAGHIYITGTGASLVICLFDQTLTTTSAVDNYFANHPLTIEYDRATPTTESADPYTERQNVDDFGTEEFVDTRTVPIPVGHNTRYVVDLKAKLEMSPNSPDGDGDYIVRQTNGTNHYVQLTFPADELPAPPSTDGNYVLKCTVSSGEASYSWTAE